MFAAILGAVARGGAMLARGGAVAGRGVVAGERAATSVSRASMLSQQFGSSERRAQNAPAQPSTGLGSYTSNATGAKFYSN